MDLLLLWMGTGLIPQLKAPEAFVYGWQQLHKETPIFRTYQVCVAEGALRNLCAS